MMDKEIIINYVHGFATRVKKELTKYQGVVFLLRKDAINFSKEGI